MLTANIFEMTILRFATIRLFVHKKRNKSAFIKMQETLFSEHNDALGEKRRGKEVLIDKRAMRS